MKNVADFIYEAGMLKRLPRSGYAFLGGGSENVAEHSFLISVIAFALAKMEDDIDTGRLVSMCLLHDLPEARTGDLNYVQKKYCDSHEERAVSHQAKGLPFGDDYLSLINEFNEGKTRESLLAKDADQLAFVHDLRMLMDTGHKGADKWLDVVLSRITTDTGKALAQAMVERSWDGWWMDGYSE